MRLIKQQKADPNYLSKIVQIDNFRPHPNADKLKLCTVDGYQLIVGLDYEPGIYVYFPALSCINSDFLSWANLYKHSDLNHNHEKSGMFEDNGRVKVIKLRNELSEGFALPVSILEEYITYITHKKVDNINVGLEFNAVEDNGKEFWLSKKYVIKRQESFTRSKTTKEVPKGLDRIIETQFRFHYDTTAVKKHPNVITPDSFIHLSFKMHGTSAISAYVLCNRPKKWYEKIYEFLTGDHIEATKYDYIYASRTVIKNKYYNPNVGSGYYSDDIWKYGDDVVRPHLQKGQTVYYEIVGFLSDGKYIQSLFDYGCSVPRKNETYTYGKHFKIYVYRITYTNVDGKVFEFTPHQVKYWCELNDLPCVEECYYGKAKDLYPELDPNNHWNENFIDKLSNDKNFYMELDSPHCINKVPHEGLVIKIDNNRSEAFKLKCFKFLNKKSELMDKGEIDMEDLA